jgi:hypothetical protein
MRTPPSQGGNGASQQLGAGTAMYSKRRAMRCASALSWRQTSGGSGGQDSAGVGQRGTVIVTWVPAARSRVRVPCSCSVSVQTSCRPRESVVRKSRSSGNPQPESQTCRTRACSAVACSATRTCPVRPSGKACLKQLRAFYTIPRGVRPEHCNGPYKLDRSYQAFSGQSPLGVPVARPPQTRLE